MPSSPSNCRGAPSNTQETRDTAFKLSPNPFTEAPNNSLLGNAAVREPTLATREATAQEMTLRRHCCEEGLVNESACKLCDIAAAVADDAITNAAGSEDEFEKTEMWRVWLGVAR